MQTFGAAHDALYNMDILYIVINILINCDPSTRHRDTADLAMLARVCKAFHELVLDQLWGRIDTFTPVFTLWNAIISSPCSSVNLAHIRTGF